VEGMVANHSRVHRGTNSRNMELTCSDEQSYQLELQVYRTTFLDFKYEPFNFVFVEIRTSNKVPIKPFMVQLVAITKLITH
jgi:hypothetical protein